MQNMLESILEYIKNIKKLSVPVVYALVGILYKINMYVTAADLIFKFELSGCFVWKYFTL